MQTKGKRGYAILVGMLTSVSQALAHVEHAESSVSSISIWYRIFVLHDWIHPVFFLLMIASCYYVRISSSKPIAHHPEKCLGNCAACYKPEGLLKRYHRIFFWGTLLLTFIHIGEVIPSLATFATFSGIDLWILLSESAYLGFAFFYLGTCYHFRYCIERLAKRRWLSYRFYNRLTMLNRYHNVFFWLTITTVIIRFTLVAIDTQSVLQAIPGTF